MMAIFDKWTKGNPQAEEWTAYTYVDGILSQRENWKNHE